MCQLPVARTCATFVLAIVACVLPKACEACKLDKYYQPLQLCESPRVRSMETYFEFLK